MNRRKFFKGLTAVIATSFVSKQIINEFEENINDVNDSTIIIKTNGNVSLGSESPNYKLHVKQNVRNEKRKSCFIKKRNIIFARKT